MPGSVLDGQPTPDRKTGSADMIPTIRGDAGQAAEIGEGPRWEIVVNANLRNEYVLPCPRLGGEPTVRAGLTLRSSAV